MVLTLQHDVQCRGGGKNHLFSNCLIILVIYQSGKAPNAEHWDPECDDWIFFSAIRQIQGEDNGGNFGFGVQSKQLTKFITGK